jgi:TrkA domain protein
MADVEETLLPGVGVRYEFVTSQGDRLGVLVRHGERRDLFAASAQDPDAFDTFARLDVDDAHTLADLLGVPHIGSQLNVVEHEIEGLAIDWVRVRDGAPVAGRSLADSAIRTLSGVSVVAVTRADGEVVVSPTADFVLQVGDLIVGVGKPEGVELLSQLTQAPH